MSSFTPRPVSFFDRDGEKNTTLLSSAKAQLGKVFSRFASSASSPPANNGASEKPPPPPPPPSGNQHPSLRKSSLKKTSSPPDFSVERHGKVTFAKEEEEEEEEEEAHRRVLRRGRSSGVGEGKRRDEEMTTTAPNVAETRKREISAEKREETTTGKKRRNDDDEDNNNNEYTEEEILEMETIVRMAKRRKVMGGGDGDGGEPPVRQPSERRRKRSEEVRDEVDDDKSPHASVRDILHAYRQRKMANKTRYASRPRGLAATAGATSYGLLRPKVSSEKRTLLLPSMGTNGAAVNGGTPSAKLAPPIRDKGMPTSHNVLKKRDPRIVSTPGPVSIGFAQGERSKKRSRVGEDEFMPSSVMNRNVSRKLDSSSPPLRVQQDQEQQQTPKVDLSAVRAAKEKMATQTASKILRALDRANEFRSGGATPGRKPSFTPAETTGGQPPSRLKSTNQKGLNVSFADDARTPSPAAGGAGTAPPSHRMSTPYPAKNGGSGGENEFNDVQGCDQSVLADTEYERLQRKYGRVAQESFEFNEERYVPESIDEDDDELDASGKNQEDNSDSESDDAPIGFKMGPGTAQKEKKQSSLSFGTKIATTTTSKQDKKNEGDLAKPPVVNLWSADFMAKNKAHQAKVQKAIEEEEGGGGAAGAPGKAAPSPFAPTTTAAAPSPFTFGIPAKTAGGDKATEKKPVAATATGGFSFGIPSATAVPTSKPNPFLVSAQTKETKETPKTDDSTKKPTFHFRAPEGSSDGSGSAGEVKPSTAKFTFAGSTPSAAFSPAATTSTEPTNAAAPLLAKPASAAPTFTFGNTAPPAVAGPAATGGVEKSGLLGFLASTKEKNEEVKKDEPAKPTTFSFGGGLANAPKADEATAKPPAFTGFGAAAKLPTPTETSKKEDGETKPSPFGTTSTTTSAPPVSTSPFVFGAPKPDAAAEAPKPAAPATFAFGAAKPAETAKPATFTFGAAPAASPAAASLFGAAVAKPTTGTPPASPTPASSSPFTFGGAPPSAATVELKQAEAKAAAPFAFGSSAPGAVAPAPGASVSGGFTFGASAATAAPPSAPTFTFNAGAGGGAASAPNPFATTSTNPSPFGATTAANPFGGSNNDSRPSSPFGAPAPVTGGANPFGGGGGGVGGANPFGAPAGANPFSNNAGAPPQQQQSGSFGAPSNSDSSQQVVPGGRKPIRRAKRPTRR